MESVADVCGDFFDKPIFEIKFRSFQCRVGSNSSTKKSVLFYLNFERFKRNLTPTSHTKCAMGNSQEKITPLSSNFAFV